MAIVFERKLLAVLEDRSINKSALRNDIAHNGSLRPTVLYKLFSKNRAVAVTTETIDRLCKQLNCQPGDIMEYIPDSDLKSMGMCNDPDELQSKRKKPDDCE
jgi:putative transcriptional regulator